MASFRTAPDAGTPRAVSFTFGGDVGGQNVCRDAREGYPIFDAVAAAQPDFFVALGDMIYADDVCLAEGRYGNAQVPGDFPRASRREDWWAHWRYNRADPALQALLARTPVYTVWDDHETANDFGPAEPAPPHAAGISILPLGLRALLDWNPIAEDPRAPLRLFRSVRWGRHLELFLLDLRQYRDANAAPDAGAKTLLGAAQREWLERSLAASDATWKLIASSVPLAIPTGSAARDGWADGGGEGGFEDELLALLRTLHRAEVRDLVWITTDVHFATAFRHRPLPEHPDWVMHELVTGPLHAGVFASRVLDETLRPERLFFHGPQSPSALRSYAQARRFFNFGRVAVDEAGELLLEVRDVAGRTLFARRLAPGAAATATLPASRASRGSS
jgi:alkaline phosphatase D